MGARGVIVLVVALVVLGLALFLFDLPRQHDDDMAPSIRKGDLLFACRMCGAPARGDIVVFTPPDGKGLSVRRVVGLPGDRIEVRHGVVLVEGKALVAEGANERNGRHVYPVLRDGGGATAERVPVKLGDQYFLEADNRGGTKDSRDYGPVAHADVRSTVLRVLRRGDGDAARPRRIP